MCVLLMCVLLMMVFFFIDVCDDGVCVFLLCFNVDVVFDVWFRMNFFCVSVNDVFVDGDVVDVCVCLILFLILL